MAFPVAMAACIGLWCSEMVLAGIANAQYVYIYINSNIIKEK
jgi:hypothetical protein